VTVFSILQLNNHQKNDGVGKPKSMEKLICNTALSSPGDLVQITDEFLVEQVGIRKIN
jgi:hypothetical protein